MVLRKIYTSNRDKAFTLIEVLMVLAMLGFIASATVWFSINSFHRELLSDEESTLVSLLQTARSNALNNIDGTAHGVSIDPYGVPEYVLFSGDNFLNATKKQGMPRSSAVFISSSSLSEVVFLQLSGTVGEVGQILMFGSGSAASSTITINYEGAIY